ncbi:guanine nucleotide-exchange factor Sec12p [Monosporozyma unispora]|nr:Guanine nucleotide-exchange factor S12 [Kazachstania unispora]
MRFANSKFTADYPLYGANFIQSNAQKATLLVTGGGGEGKNGIPNMITSYRFTAQTGQFDKLQEIELPEDDDSPTAMDASIQTGVVLVGCNENSEKVKSGKGNKHLRKYNMDLRLQLEPAESIDLFHSSNPDEYTKVIQLSSDGKLGAVCSSKESEAIIKIIDAETLEERFEINDANKEVKDISFAANGKYFAYITPNSLEIISTVTGKSITRLNQEFDANKWNLSKMKFIDNNSLLIVATKHDHADKKHSGIVLLKVSVRNGKAAITQSKLLTNKFKGITAMDLHEENDVLALATSENSILICKLSNFDIKGTFNQIHTFAVTKITISPNGKYVVSVSAANTIHMIQIPINFKHSMSNRKENFQLWSSAVLLLVAIIFYKISTDNKEYFKAKIAEKNIQLPEVLNNIIKGYMKMKDLNKPQQFREEINTQELFNQTTLVGNSTSSMGNSTI